ncbi:hypothetical protein DID77_01375, partial [Candidatus Marinamargulisbacteria bacterium SCGC AG-439-L15]
MLVYSGIFIFSVVAQWLTIKLLCGTQVFQKIYELSPKSHQKKVRIPSFGGVGIFLGLCLGLWVSHTWNSQLFWVVLVMFGFGMIGFLDDLLSYINTQNKGLSARNKFLLEVLIGSGCLFLFAVQYQTISWSIFLFYLFVMVGSANATNLTDGLDGLLGG